MTFPAVTCGSDLFGDMKALRVVSLNIVVLRARIPTARFLELIWMDGPSNWIFCTSSSTVFRALRRRREKQSISTMISKGSKTRQILVRNTEVAFNTAD